MRALRLAEKGTMIPGTQDSEVPGCKISFREVSLAGGDVASPAGLGREGFCSEFD